LAVRVSEVPSFHLAERMASSIGGGGGRGETVHGAFAAVCAAMGDAPALVTGSPDGVPSPPLVPVSFARLLKVCAAFASHLEGSGSGGRSEAEGARAGPPRIDGGALVVDATVGVMLDSSDELMVTYFACLMAGKSFAPVETSLPRPALEGLLASLAASANLTHLVVSSATQAGSIDTVVSPPRVPTPATAFRIFAVALRLSALPTMGGDAGAGAWCLEVREMGTEPRTLSVDGGGATLRRSIYKGNWDDACHVIHTGGSTGAPKAGQGGGAG
jgi:acyl-CoA synthetase (AMP-forming)/AMP-acid ligase II